MSIGSFICVRNGFQLDYSWVEAAESLLKVVDELVLCDSESTDGTFQAMQRMADRDPRIKVITYPWPKPVRESHFWFLKWLRFAQSHVKSSWLIYLDADEVLDDSSECHAALREAAAHGKAITVDRINYWRSANEVIPDGHCCGKWCVRGGPTKYPVVSDEPHHKGEEPVVDEAIKEPRVKIHHLGFLRKQDAFYAKSKVVLEGWFGRWDTRLEDGQKANKPVWETECEFTDLLVPFTGYQPDAVQRWFSDRGHDTQNYLGKVIIPPDPVIHVAETLDENDHLNVLHCGDLGDIIHCLAVLKATRRPIRMFFGDRNAICKRIVERLPILAPLLWSQHWIIEVKIHEGEKIHWNAGDFRFHHSLTSSLASAHYRHYLGQKHLPKVVADFSQPWISGISPDPRSRGKILVARTSRYNNAYFQWKEIVRQRGSDIIFLGLPSEHSRFCEQFGDVAYLPTKNLLEVAQLIAGSDFVIANQSAILAVAEAMKHPRLIEVCPHQPDVLTAITPEVVSTVTGAAKIPAMSGKPPLTLPSGLACINYLAQTNTIPKDGWRLGNLIGSYYEDLETRVMKERGVNKKEAKRLILDDLYNRQPGYFGAIKSMGITEKYEQAVMNAQRH